MSKKHTTIDQAGANLVQASKKQSEDSLPLSTRLFPYIHIASRRMSLRTMSAWLKDNHKVSISAGQISRALRQPDLHLERLADFIAPSANYVASAYGCDAMQLLFDAYTENGPSWLHILSTHEHPAPESESDLPRWEELQFLASVWEPIPDEVQQLLRPYLSELLSEDDSDPN